MVLNPIYNYTSMNNLSIFTHEYIRRMESLGLNFGHYVHIKVIITIALIVTIASSV